MKPRYFLQCLVEHWFKGITHFTRFFLLWVNSAVNFLIYFTFNGGFEYLRKIFYKNNINLEENHEMVAANSQQ